MKRIIGGNIHNLHVPIFISDDLRGLPSLSRRRDAAYVVIVLPY